VQQIATVLPDVPQATLYRHLNILLKGEILTVVRENKVRGTIEKVFALAEHGADLSEEEIARASREDHLNYFFRFLIHLLGDFENYLRREELDMRADGVTYRQYSSYLSDQEYSKLIASISGLLKSASNYDPTPDRKLRSITTIAIPLDIKPAGKLNNSGGKRL